jgi:hypothetical protein
MHGAEVDVHPGKNNGFAAACFMDAEVSELEQATLKQPSIETATSGRPSGTFLVATS